MRGLTGVILTGLGAFILLIGPLVHFYVAPRLIAAPTDVYQVTRLRADAATYFDAASLKTRTGAALIATNTVRGDVTSSHGRLAVWDTTTTVQDIADKALVDVQNQRVAFDRRSGRLTKCCGAAVQSDVTAPQSGIGLFWPVNVQKKTYQLYDSQTRRAWPIRFEGVQEVAGVRAYRFRQQIPETKVRGQVPDIPGDLLGRSKKSAAVAVDRYYEADATYWIDPRTGAPIDQRQKITSTLKPRSGPGSLVVASMDLHMTPESRRELIAKSDEGADQIRMLRTVVPMSATIGGLVLVGLGLALVPRAGRAGRHRQESAVPVAASA